MQFGASGLASRPELVRDKFSETKRKEEARKSPPAFHNTSVELNRQDRFLTAEEPRHRSRMGSWSLPWSFTLLLAGAVGQSVTHPDCVCAVVGSTVTLPCTFSPLRYLTQSNGRRISLQVIRVRWCQNHPICQGSTPSVYDSQRQNSNTRYQYLGNLQDRCTLQIRGVQREDNAVLRFRMEVNHTEGHFTEQSGVRVTAVERSQLRINSSSADTPLSSGHTVTLYCTSVCTFHQLEVTWFRGDHALSESGPALQLGPLTPNDSGNYTCALRTKTSARSQPYSVFVKEDSGGSSLVMVGVVVGVLLALSCLVLSFVIIRRKLAAAEKDQRAEAREEHFQNLYSCVLQPAELEGGGQAPEDVNYASVQFVQRNQTRRAEADHAVIYTTLSHYPPKEGNPTHSRDGTGLSVATLAGGYHVVQ